MNKKNFVKPGGDDSKAKKEFEKAVDKAVIAGTQQDVANMSAFLQNSLHYDPAIDYQARLKERLDKAKQRAKEKAAAAGAGKK